MFESLGFNASYSAWDKTCNLLLNHCVVATCVELVALLAVAAETAPENVAVEPDKAPVILTVEENVAVPFQVLLPLAVSLPLL